MSGMRPQTFRVCAVTALQHGNIRVLYLSVLPRNATQFLRTVFEAQGSGDQVTRRLRTAVTPKCIRDAQHNRSRHTSQFRQTVLRLHCGRCAWFWFELLRVRVQGSYPFDADLGLRYHRPCYSEVSDLSRLTHTSDIRARVPDSAHV